MAASPAATAGTTSGAIIGAQTGSAATAGPIAALGGTSYQIHETAASGSLGRTTPSWRRVSITATADAPVPLTPATPGSTTDFSLVFPRPRAVASSAAVACTFTNTPAGAPAILTLSKVLVAARVGPTPISSASRSGTGSATGRDVSATAEFNHRRDGRHRHFGQRHDRAVHGGRRDDVLPDRVRRETTTNLTDYLATISCTDSANRQTGLPGRTACFAGSIAISPVNGARIACVISNGVQSYTVSESAGSAAGLPPPMSSAIPPPPPTPGSYSYPAGAASFAIDLTGQLDDGARRRRARSRPTPGAPARQRRTP